MVVSETPCGTGEMLGETTRFLSNKGLRIYRNPLFLLAGATRFELATFGVTGRRSNQLNYAPNLVSFLNLSPVNMVGGTGIEPVTSGL